MMRVSFGTIAGLVGVFALLEFASGFIQGYYTPLVTDIARHLSVGDGDVNWLEGAQLMLAALAVPLLAKLGDLFGHRRMLLVSTGITASTALALPFIDAFPLFLAVWALQGVYVVWLPLEIAVIWVRTEGREHRAALTGRAAGLLIVSLQFGILSGALLGGRLSGALPLPGALLVPALVVVGAFLAVLFGVRAGPAPVGGRIDLVGFGLLAATLLAVLGGLGLLRFAGPAQPAVWGMLAAGVVLAVVFARWELRQADPFIDARLFSLSRLGPLFIATALFGIGVLGAQIPLVTFVRTDPAVAGYGLGLDGFGASLVIAWFLAAMMIGAYAYSRAAARVPVRALLGGAAILIATGHLLFLVLHTHPANVLANLAVIGLGSGALLGALPAMAVAAAPERGSGIVAGLSNSSKIAGGAVASAVFGVALATGAGAGPGGGAAPMQGYLVVWTVCGASALVAAALLLFGAPRVEAAVEAEERPQPAVR